MGSHSTSPLISHTSIASCHAESRAWRWRPSNGKRETGKNGKRETGHGKRCGRRVWVR